MKTIVFALLSLFIQTIVSAQETDNTGVSITVTIDNAQNDLGKMLFSLHNATTFMKGKGVDNAETIIKNGTAQITFTNVQQGEYAILVLHDANSNYQMDFESNGMPKEAFGTSGETMSMGPPDFEYSKFKVIDENISLNIRL